MLQKISFKARKKITKYTALLLVRFAVRSIQLQN